MGYNCNEVFPFILLLIVYSWVFYFQEDLKLPGYQGKKRKEIVALYFCCLIDWEIKDKIHLVLSHHFKSSIIYLNWCRSFWRVLLSFFFFFKGLKFFWYRKRKTSWIRLRIKKMEKKDFRGNQMDLWFIHLSLYFFNLLE